MPKPLYLLDSSNSFQDTTPCLLNYPHHSLFPSTLKPLRSLKSNHDFCSINTFMYVIFALFNYLAIFLPEKRLVQVRAIVQNHKRCSSSVSELLSLKCSMIILTESIDIPLFNEFSNHRIPTKNHLKNQRYMVAFSHCILPPLGLFSMCKCMQNRKNNKGKTKNKGNNQRGTYM